MKRFIDDDLNERPRKRLRYEESTHLQHTDLVPDVIRVIAERLVSPVDYCAYAQTCKTVASLIHRTPLEDTMKKRYFDDFMRVCKDPSYLENVNEQTSEICLAAVERDGLALKHVREQTPEICLVAVQQNWQALHCVYAIHRSFEIYLAAAKQNTGTIKEIPSTEVTRRVLQALLKTSHVLTQ